MDKALLRQPCVCCLFLSVWSRPDRFVESFPQRSHKARRKIKTLGNISLRLSLSDCAVQASRHLKKRHAELKNSKSLAVEIKR